MSIRKKKKKITAWFDIKVFISPSIVKENINKTDARIIDSPKHTCFYILLSIIYRTVWYRQLTYQGKTTRSCNYFIDYKILNYFHSICTPLIGKLNTYRIIPFSISILFMWIPLSNKYFCSYYKHDYLTVGKMILSFLIFCR